LLQPSEFRFDFRSIRLFRLNLPYEDERKMQLKKKSNPSSKEIIVFTSAAMILTALGIDIMLPAFGEIRKLFGLPDNSAQTANLISYFFMGQITQLFFGYLTDKWGRLPVLKTGFIIYIISGFAVVVAPTLGWMFLFRFFAGMGAAAVLMTTIAAIRDRYAGDAMARVMSFVLTIMLFTPVIAPALGALVLRYFSWQVVFIIPPAFAILVFIWSFRIEETHPKEARLKTGFLETLPAIGQVLRDRHFMRYCTIATLVFAILSSYVASSERIISEIYHQPQLFPLIFGSIGIVMALFAFSNSYFSKRFGARPTLRVFLVAYFITALCFTLLHLFFLPSLPLEYFVLCIGMLMSLTLGADPNSSALALQFMGQKAGIAASVYGTLFFFAGSGIGALISNLLKENVLPLAIAALLISTLNLALFFSEKKKG
jgi:MFS transporter, DHA1 family, multidrug resistance protein